MPFFVFLTYLRNIFMRSLDENKPQITIHYLKGNIIEIMGKITVPTQWNFEWHWPIFSRSKFFLPKKITFRGLCKELCNDVCPKNTNNCRKNKLSENVYFWHVLATIKKQVDFFHKKGFSPMPKKLYLSL